MSVSFSPIGPWPLVAVAALVVMVLTVWAYQQRLRGTTGRWRWLALALRLAAVLLCLLAALRPSVVIQEKKKSPASIVFLIDDSLSMSLGDEVHEQKRWAVALRTLSDARSVAKGLGPGLEVKYYRFNTSLREQKTDDQAPPEGRETALGTALMESVRRQTGTRVAAIVVLSDGASNDGVPPLVAARRLRSQQVPVIAVGFGSETAGAASRDIAVRDIVAGPTVFVKNQLQVRGTLVVRGFANRPIDVDLFVDGQSDPVATKRITVPEGTEVVPITGLKYIPQTAGEKKITLRVKPREGELIASNNEISTFVNVLKGGLNVLYIQGPNFTWEYKFLTLAIAASPDIQADLKVVRKPADMETGELKDAEFTPLRYDVYILGDLPADHLTSVQQRLLAAAVEKGAGLIMLGGRSSFGAGGWADTDLARLLPVELHPGDGQLEPEGGLKFVPNVNGLESYVLQVGPSRAETARIWEVLPPITGTNRFGDPKANAIVLGETPGPNPEPIMIGMETGKARVLAFGGETWVWARASDEGLLAHRKFWRQVIFWLSHKEDQGENTIKIALDRRRIAKGQKLDLTVTARNSKNAPITDAKYTATVTREGTGGKPETVPIYNLGEEAHGSYFATAEPGDYKVTVSATRDGHDIGSDKARFQVYQDDRELENPAADLALLRQVAELTEGKYLSSEQLPKHLKSLSGKLYTEYISQTEHKIWDNWPFFLLFTALLTLEWWLRKRNGWV